MRAEGVAFALCFGKQGGNTYLHPAEIQNTLRAGTEVALSLIDIVVM